MVLRSALACFALLMGPAGLVSAQLLPPADPSRPSTYLFKDLPSEFQAVEIRTESSATMEALIRSMSAGPVAPMAMILSTVSYTKNQRVEWNDVEYLVAYRADFSNLDAQAKPLGDTPMRLTYIDVDSIVEMTPREDLAPKLLLQQVAAQATPRQVDAPQSQTLNNIKQVATGLIIYSADYDDQFPYVTSTADARAVTQPYHRSSEVWKSQNPRGNRILYNTFVGRVPQTAIPNPARVVMVYEEFPWPDGRRAVGFADGHARFVPEAEFQRLLAAFRPKAPNRPPIRVTAGGF